MWECGFLYQTSSLATERQWAEIVQTVQRTVFLGKRFFSVKQHGLDSCLDLNLLCRCLGPITPRALEPVLLRKR